MTDRENLMRKIQSYLFAAEDFVLYLDTHPEDKKAIEMHKALVKKAQEAVCEYEQQFGPLTSSSSWGCSEKWDWIESPWPWE